MLPQGTSIARGHLRLASGSAAPSPGRRLAVHLRALVAVLATLWSTVMAGIGVLVALLPLLVRPSPVGRRAPRRPPREARVIPFQPRRRAVPR